MRHVVFGCGLTSVGGKVYVVGRYDDSRFVASCEIFDPDIMNEWRMIPDMKKARFGCAACAIGVKLYSIGGVDGGYA